MLEARRAPTTESGSSTSTTVEVVLVTRTTRPTSPSLLITVMSACSTASLPASMVTVSEKDWREPTAINLDGTRSYPGSEAAFARPSYSERGPEERRGGKKRVK